MHNNLQFLFFYSKGASETDIPCTSKTNSWKGRAANSKSKIQIEKVPLETYDFNKVTILGEKHRNVIVVLVYNPNNIIQQT
jgi:hypothetical protein